MVTIFNDTTSHTRLAPSHHQTLKKSEWPPL